MHASPLFIKTYTVTASTPNGCSTNASATVTVNNCSINTWTGLIDNDWFKGGNWSCNIIPTTFTNALIPTGVSIYPVISGAPGNIATTKDLTIQTGASVTVSGLNGVPLNIYGNFTNSGIANMGSGLVSFTGGSSQTISGVSNIANVTIANTSGVAVTASSGNMLNVAKVLTLNSGNLTTNGNLTILSDATGTGLVNDFTSGNTGTIIGNLKVQRYAFNATGGSYFIGSAVGGATISQWSAEFGNPSYNNAVDGSQVIPYPDCNIVHLEPTSPYAGIFDYRENMVTSCNLQGWFTRFSGAINSGQGYIGRVPDATTLSLSGTYNTGLVSSPLLTSTATNTTASKGYNLIANPYASPIDWLLVSRNRCE